MYLISITLKLIEKQEIRLKIFLLIINTVFKKKKQISIRHSTKFYISALWQETLRYLHFWYFLPHVIGKKLPVNLYNVYLWLWFSVSGSSIWNIPNGSKDARAKKSIPRGFALFYMLKVVLIVIRKKNESHLFSFESVVEANQ